MYKGCCTPCFRPSGKNVLEPMDSSLWLDTCLQTEVLNSAFQIQLKQALKVSSVPAFIIVTLWESDRKTVWKMPILMHRMVLPKGTSFEYPTQWDVNMIVNHINSTPRNSLDVKHLMTLRWNHSVKTPWKHFSLSVFHPMRLIWRLSWAASITN